MLTLAYVFQNPDLFVRVQVFDVVWTDGGLGKHGHGPFATEAQALACIRSVGWPGRVHRYYSIKSCRDVYRIFKGRSLPHDAVIVPHPQLF